MATLKEFFGYALQNANTNMIPRILNLSDLMPDVRRYIKENSQFKGVYSDNVSMLIFNSLFTDNSELTMWIVGLLKKRGIIDKRLDENIKTVLYFATDEKMVNRERLNSYFSKLINAKKNYYETPLIYKNELKQYEEDTSSILIQRDLLNPFFAQLKLAKGIDPNNKTTENFVENVKDYSVVSNAIKILSSKSISAVKDALLVLVPYICLNYNNINDFNINEFKEKLEEFNLLVLSFSESITEEKLKKLNQFRKYIYEITTKISFKKLSKEVDYSKFEDLFNKIFTYYEKMYLRIIRNGEDIDNNRYFKLSKSEKLDLITTYFKTQRTKGELDYNVSLDDPRVIIKLSKYLNEYNKIKNDVIDQGRGRTR